MASQTPQSQSTWWRIVHMEPALIRGFVIALFALLASLGIAVSDVLPDNLIAIVVALFAIIQAVWTRSAVVAEDKVVVYLKNPAEGTGVTAGKAVPADFVDRKAVEAAAYREAA